MNEREDLDARMSDLIARMTVISEVAAAGYQPTGRSGATDSGLGPSGTAEIMGEKYALRYGEPFHTCTSACGHRVARTDEERRAVIEDAESAIARRGGHVKQFKVGAGMKARVSEVRPESDEAELLETLKREIVEHGEGWTVKELAVKHRCAERIVIKARKENGREPEFGKRPEFQGGRKASRAEAEIEAKRQRALELDAQGMRVPQIALALGISRQSVKRYLEGRRAA